eukprot:Gb_29696 [translate_table: standard]
MMLGDGTEHLIVGRGTVSITMPNGEVKEFGNVLNVLVLTKSLLSIRIVTCRGCKWYLLAFSWKLTLMWVMESGNTQRRLVRLNLSRYIGNIFASGSAKNALVLRGYCDGDWAYDVDQERSTSRGLMSWLSKKQQTISLFNVEVKYISACCASKELVWLRKLFPDLDIEMQYNFVRAHVEKKVLQMEFDEIDYIMVDALRVCRMAESHGGMFRHE